MKSKKSPKAELETRRPFFFLTGLSLALIMAIVAFQWRTELIVIKDSLITGQIEDNSFEIPRTVRPAPEKPKVQTKFNKDKIALVDDIFKNEPKLDLKDLIDLGDEGQDEEGVEDIGQDIDWEEIETIPFVVVEQIAMPQSCKDLGTRDEQIECLNEWMANYIRSEVKFPSIARQMGLSGKVWVTFVVGRSGNIVSTEIARGEHEVLNNEALRVIESMPKWIPASQKKKEVRMTMTIPINFSY